MSIWNVVEQLRNLGPPETVPSLIKSDSCIDTLCLTLIMCGIVSGFTPRARVPIKKFRLMYEAS